MRLLAITLLAFAMSCSKQDATDPLRPQEDQAIAIASAKCKTSGKMPWLRDIIRKAESDVSYKGVVYAIEYSNGVAFMHQPWVSSCYACLVYDCEGGKLTTSASVMDEIIKGATEDNVIYSSH